MNVASQNKKAILKDSGRLFVLDELAATKSFVEIAEVDNINFSVSSTPIELKTASGVTIYKTAYLEPKVSFDLYHPGDLSVIERLFRGAVSKTALAGSVPVAAEKCIIRFAHAGDCAVLPGFNGAGTAATVNSIKKASDTSVIYTVSTDYTVSVDANTGMTLVNHVTPGATPIPLNTDLLVDYDYTPLKSTILRPLDDTELTERFFKIVSYPDASDTTKYRAYFLPNSTVTSEIVHKLLGVGTKDGAKSPNIMSVSLDYRTPEQGSNEPRWYTIDTYNV